MRTLWAMVAVLSVSSVLAGGPVPPAGPGAIVEWLVGGPYPAYRTDAGNDGLMTDFLAPIGGEDVAVPHPGLAAKAEFKADVAKLIAQIGSANEWGFRETKTFDATWKVRSFADAPVGKNLNGVFAPIDDWFACYLCAYIELQRGQRVVVSIGADDEHKVWMDDRLLGQSATSQAVHPGEFRYPVQLGEGVHRLLVKIVDRANDAGFACAVTDSKGCAVEGLAVHLDPRGRKLVLDAERTRRQSPEYAEARRKKAAERLEAVKRRLPDLETREIAGRAAEEAALMRYEDAIRGVEAEIAAARAQAVAKAPRSTALPLEAAPGLRSRLCVNGHWEASTDGGKSWSDIVLPARILGANYFLGHFYPVKSADPKKPHGKKIPLPGWEGKVDIPPAVLQKKVRFRTTFDWNGKGTAQFVCEALIGRSKFRVNGVDCGEDECEVGVTTIPLKGLRKGKNVLEIDYERCELRHHEHGFLGDSFIDFVPTVRTEAVAIKTSWRKAELSVSAELVNETGAAEEVEVRQYAVEKDVIRLSLPTKRGTVPAGGRLTLSSASAWADPKPWGPGGRYGDPDLYELVTDVYVGGRRVDRHVETFGFREFTVRSTQFFLNGRRISLQGDTGCSLNHPFRAREVLWPLLRADGVNTMRYHDSQYWSVDAVRAADRMGMLTHAQMYPRLHTVDEGKVTVKNFMPLEEFLRTDEHRRNLRNYRRWYLMLRNSPSVVLWSTDNEVMTQSWDTSELEPLAVRNDRLAAHYEKYVKAFDPDIVMTRDGDCGTWGRAARWHEEPPCDTANYHYPDFNVDEKVIDWQRIYDWRPAVYGETLYHSYGAWNKWIGALPQQVNDKAAQLREVLSLYRRLSVPGQICMGLSHDGFIVKGTPDVFGSTDAVWHRVDWPSVSGCGEHHPYAEIDGSMYGRSAVNWFDDSRPSHVRNAVNDAYRESFEPQVQLRIGSDAEVIVEGAAPGAAVWTQNADGSRTGVRADPQGRAWFRYLAPGARRFTDGRRVRSVFLAPRGAVAAHPGFAAIRRLSLAENDDEDVTVLTRRAEKLENGVFRHERTVETLDTASRLMSGAMTELPPVAGRGTLVRSFHTDKEKTFVSESVAERHIAMQHVPIVPGRTYRVTAELRAEAVSDSARIKFGGMIRLPTGKVAWPAAKVGSFRPGSVGSFDWLKAEFTYRAESGAEDMAVVFGISDGATGRLDVRNIEIYEIR